MANYVASIIASLGLDARAFKAEIAGAQKAVDAFGAKLVGIPNLSGVLGAAGVAAGVKSLIDYGAEVQHLSDRFGVSTDAIQKFGNAAEENGVSMESVARAFNKLEVATGRALAGNEEVAQAFQRMNISAADLKNLKPEELMEKIGHSSMNAADLVAVLGRNGTELRPILRGLADGTIEFRAAISGIDIKRLEDADKTCRKMYETVRVLGAESVSRFIEGLKDLRSEAEHDAGAVKTAWSSAGDVFSKLFAGKISEANKAAKEFTENFSLGAAVKQLVFPSKETFEPTKPASPEKTKKPRTKEEDEEESKLEEKRRDKLDQARAETDILRAHLDHLDAIAKALEIHLNYEKKIASARAEGNSQLASELQLQERLALAQAGQAIAEKNQDRLKFDLHELAGMQGDLPLLNRDISLARQAESEQSKADALRDRGDFEGAERHIERAEQIKERIGALKDSEKDMSGSVRLGIDAARITQLMQQVVENTANQIAVVNE